MPIKNHLLILFCAMILAGVLYQLIHKPDFSTPTLEQLNIYTLLPYPQERFSPNPLSLQDFIAQIQQKKSHEISCVSLKEKSGRTKQLTIFKNIPDKKILEPRITLYSRGYAARLQTFPFNSVPRIGGGVVAAYTHIRDHVIHTPCVTFDRWDGHAHFSFGQDFDIRCLEIVYDAIIAQNPDIVITLMADCLGGLIALRFIAQNPEKTRNIDTIILESPLVSAHDFFEQTPISIQQFIYKKIGITLSSGFLHALLHTALSWWFSNYDPACDTLDTCAIKNKRIFIGHLHDDFVISNSGIKNLVEQLRAHNAVTFVTLLPEHFEGTIPAHCQLAQSGYYQRAVNEFFCRYDLKI